MVACEVSPSRWPCSEIKSAHSMLMLENLHTCVDEPSGQRCHGETQSRRYGVSTRALMAPAAETACDAMSQAAAAVNLLKMAQKW